MGNENQKGEREDPSALYEQGLQLMRQEKFEECERALRACLEIWEKNSNHRERVDGMLSLSQCFQKQPQRHEDSEVTIREALDVIAIHIPDNESLKAEAMLQLARCLSEDRSKERDQWYRAACEIWRHDGSHRKRATALKELGDILFNQKQYADAEEVLAQAVGAIQLCEPVDEGVLCEVFLYLGVCQCSQKKLEDARQSCLLALQLCEKLGDHVLTSAAICAIGCVLTETQGQVLEAVEMFRSATDIQKKLFGEDDPNRTMCLLGFGKCLLTAASYFEAESVFAEIIRIRKMTAVCDILNDMMNQVYYLSGLSMWHQGKALECVETLTRRLDRSTQHPQAFARLGTALLALSLQLQRGNTEGSCSEVDTLIASALHQLSDVDEEDAQTLVLLFVSEAQCLQANWISAKANLQQVLQLKESCKGLCLSGYCALAETDYANAERLFRRALEVMSEKDYCVLTPPHPMKGKVLLGLGRALCEQKKVDESQTVLTESVNCLVSRIPKHYRAREAIQSFVCCLKMQKKHWSLVRHFLLEHMPDGKPDSCYAYDESATAVATAFPAVKDAIIETAINDLTVLDSQGDPADPSQLQVEVATLLEKNGQLRSSVERLFSEGAALKRRADDSEMRNQNLRDEISCQSHEIRALQERWEADKAESSQRLQVMSERVEEQQHEEEALRRQLAEQEQQNREHRQVNMQLQEAAQQLETEKATIIAQFNVTLQEQTREKDVEINALRRQLQAEEARRNELEFTLTREVQRAQRAQQEAELTAEQYDRVMDIPDEELQLTGMRLGGGASGEVRLGRWRGVPVAVKTFYDEPMRTTPRNISILRREVAMCSRLHHPNVMAICGAIVANGVPLRLVMEIQEASVSDVIDAANRSDRYLTLREQIDLAEGSACGVMYLHQLRPSVLHGDIRPTNILVTRDMEAKIGDLGTSRFVNAALSFGPVSAEYIAPERMPEGAPSGRNTAPGDIYSLGVTLVETFTGVGADKSKRERQFQAVARQPMRDLCFEMATDNPDERITAELVLTRICEVKQYVEYRDCSAKRMVKGTQHGVEETELVDKPWT